MPLRLEEGVHLGDVLKLLRTVPDGCSELAIIDPPYNIGPRFGISREWHHSKEWLPWCRSWLIEVVRALKAEGQLFLYGIHHYVGAMQTLLYDLGLHYRRMIIWHYENGWSRSARSLATHYEPILWFSRSEVYTYHPIREPYKSSERLRYPVRKGNLVWRPHPEGRLAGDVWSIPTLAGRRFAQERVPHPTQKPLALANRLVKHFSNPNDLVLVPFAGSGTECVSATLAGRRFWAAEVKPEYVLLTQARLRETRVDAEGRAQPS